MKKMLIMMGLSTIISTSALAVPPPSDGFGETIQIHTNLRTFVGKPSWLLIIRDLDHNQNIPYLYDFTRGSNYWVALTYGVNYEITVSEMTFNPYDRKIKNFCNLRSMGAIQRGTGMDIRISGDLSPNTNTYTCTVTKH